jgi:hypothetical protein
MLANWRTVPASLPFQIEFSQASPTAVFAQYRPGYRLVKETAVEIACAYEQAMVDGWMQCDLRLL